MITEENDPQMIRAQQELLRRLGIVLGGGTKVLDKGLVHELFEVVQNHRSEYRNKGVDFPVLVGVIVPRFGIVDFKRADLDIASIRIAIVNFVRANPKAKMEEVVLAFRTAYPELKPDDGLAASQIPAAKTKTWGSWSL